MNRIFYLFVIFDMKNVVTGLVPNNRTCHVSCKGVLADESHLAPRSHRSSLLYASFGFH